MKRFIPLILILSVSAYSFGQNQVDALRYSQTFPGGTARSVAMGGAFGALGGDFYSASQNPAGLGVYRKSEMTFTPEVFSQRINSRYNGTEKEDYASNFNLNNFGYVSALNSGSGIEGVNFAFGYNKLNNFRSNVSIEGNNFRSTLVDEYVASAQDYDPRDLYPYSEQLFWEGYLMDRTQDGYYQVAHEIRDTTTKAVNVDQQNNIETKGKMNEWIFGLGFNYEHKIYFGATFSIYNLYYNQSSTFREFDGLADNWQFFKFYETFTTRGTGYSGNFGMIIKPLNMLRIGIAYHLPVSYYMTDNFNANLVTPYVNGIIYPRDEYNNILDAGEFEYRLITPGRTVGSLGLVLNKMMVISSDVEYINYKSMRYPTSNMDVYDREYFQEVNNTIKEIYQATVNVKTGLEVRFDNLYVRGGFGYYGSPYASKQVNEDAYQLSYSGGIGFRNSDFFLDFGLSYKRYEEVTVLYQSDFELPNSTAASSLDSKSVKAMATLGFKF